MQRPLPWLRLPAHNSGLSCAVQHPPSRPHPRCGNKEEAVVKEARGGALVAALLMQGQLYSTMSRNGRLPQGDHRAHNAV
jgi:hypothetical protein